MLKPRMSSRRKFTTLAVVCFFVSLIAGTVLFLLVSNSYKTTPVVETTTYIKAGDMITKEMITSRNIGKYGISSNLAIRGEQVIGKYATRDFAPEEYIFGSSLTDNYLKRLSEKARYGAIAVPINLLDTVGGDIKENDFVGVLISMKKSEEDVNQGLTSDELPTSNTALIYSKELVAVRVLGVYDNKANEVSKAEGGVSSTPTMIVFDALPIQRILLNQARDNGSIRLVIHPEHIQESYRKAWGLGQEADLDEDESSLDDILDKMNRTEEQHDKLSDEYGTLEDEQVEGSGKTKDVNQGELDSLFNNKTKDDD